MPGRGPEDPPPVHRPDAGTPAPDPDAFVCDPGATPSPAAWRRLSRDAYLATLDALLGETVDADVAASLRVSIGPWLARLPADAPIRPRSGPSFAAQDRSVSGGHVESYFAVAQVLARGLVATPDRLGTLVGDCAVDADPANDGACLDDFVARFGAIAFRHPLSDAELAFFRDIAYVDGDTVVADGVAELVSVMLQSPFFLVHVERGVEALADDVVRLDDAELASRLAYHFWGAPPDAALRDAAASGRLADEAGYRDEVERLFADPRARAHLGRFVEGWLGLGALGDPASAGDQLGFRQLAGDDFPRAGFREAIDGEVSDLVRHVVWDDPGVFGDLFISNVSVTSDPAVAALYGVPPWDGMGAPPTLPAGERAGVLTRAAMLAVPSVSSHPVLRGVSIRRRVLCDPLPEPPPNLVFPQVEGIVTGRERVERQTADEACQRCHGAINPVGFALEHYDPLGRFRTDEVAIDGDDLVRDARGFPVTRPVDAAVELDLGDGDTRAIRGGVELSAALAEAPAVVACFSRAWFRHAYGRLEDEAADGCALEAVRAAATSGAPLSDVLKAVALRPEFRWRRVGPVAEETP